MKRRRFNGLVLLFLIVVLFCFSSCFVHAKEITADQLMVRISESYKKDQVIRNWANKYYTDNAKEISSNPEYEIAFRQDLEYIMDDINSNRQEAIKPTHPSLSLRDRYKFMDVVDKMQEDVIKSYKEAVEKKIPPKYICGNMYYQLVGGDF